MEDEILFMIMMIFICFIVCLVLVSITMFILQAIGLFKIANREGRQDIAWLGWIPFANVFLLTTLLEEAVHEGIKRNLTLFYGISIAVTLLLNWISPFLTILPSFIISAIYLYAFYFLAKRYSTNPLMHLVIGIVTLGLSVGVQVFLFRNSKVVDSTGLNVDSENMEGSYI